MIPDNTCILRLTAAAGTELADAYSSGTRHLIPPWKKRFTTHGQSSLTRYCSVRLSPIAENSLLLPPVGVWTVLSSSVSDRPLKPDTDRRLGKPLPYQQANQPRASLQAKKPFHSKAYGVLAAVSNCYPPPGGKFSRVTHPSATWVKNSRTTCMYKAYRQRSSWARIKLS